MQRVEPPVFCGVGVMTMALIGLFSGTAFGLGATFSVVAMILRDRVYLEAGAVFLALGIFLFFAGWV